jgi:hypothetical protein
MGSSSIFNTKYIWRKNSEVRTNNYSSYITGCGALAANAIIIMLIVSIAYGTNVADYPQSTTGNISGIYDMSGGAWEYVMGVLLDSNGNPRSGHDSTSNSGYNGMYDDGTSKTDGLVFPNTKYYQTYTTLATSSLGDALKETQGWYSDYASFVFSRSPWFMRGGYYYIGSSTGEFYFNCNGGGADSYGSSRAVIAPGA